MEGLSSLKPTSKNPGLLVLSRQALGLSRNPWLLLLSGWPSYLCLVSRITLAPSLIFRRLLRLLVLTRETFSTCKITLSPTLSL